MDADKAKEALKRDWEQTKADMPGDAGRDQGQSIGDTVRQVMGKDDDAGRSGRSDTTGTPRTTDTTGTPRTTGTTGRTGTTR